MKKLLTCLMLMMTLTAFAQQDDVLDEQRVNNGIQQIQNSINQYFTNEGWHTTWGNLNNWYVETLVNNQEAKNYLRQAINARAVYDRFNDLEYKKQNKTITYGDIDAFSQYVTNVIWMEIDRLYPPAN